MKPIQFYDLVKKKRFMSGNYTIKTRMVNGKKRKFAVCKSPLSGNMSWRVMASK